MEKKLSTARTIAGILGILLVVAIIIILTDHKTIADLKDPAKQNISAQADIIRKDCSGSDIASKGRCADDLQNLADLLSTFSKQHTASSTVNLQGGVTGSVNNIQITPK